MRTISKEFRECENNIEYYISMTLANGTTLEDLGNKDIFGGGIQIRDATSSESTFDIGNCLCRELTLKINNESGGLSEYDFANTQVSLTAKKNIGEITETVRLGKYIVDMPEFSGNTIILECVDRMILFNKKIDDISGTTAATIVNAMCTRLGVTLATQRFAGWDMEITLPDVSNMTYIELLSYICQITCNFARFNDNGQLEIRWYDVTLFDEFSRIDAGDFLTENPEVIDGGDFDTYQTDNIYDGGNFEFNYHHIYSNSTEKIITEDVVITGLCVKNEDTEALYGNEGYVLLIEDNPLTVGNEAKYAEQIGLRCVGMRFRPFNLSTRSNLLVEAGDSCIVTDRKGNSYCSYITRTTYTVNSNQMIACGAESPMLNSADDFSLVTKAVIKARKETENRITAYDVAVQQLTELMANSFGVYKTAEKHENGSHIYYMHNAPSLEKSKTIWKMTTDAFAVSTDGGKTWNAGFDSNGNAVVNVLNAIGINADWINAGTITGRKINNGNGTFAVDEKGNVVANSLKSNNAEITGGNINIETSSLEQSIISFLYNINNNAYRCNMTSGGLSNALETSDGTRYSSSIGPQQLIMGKDDYYAQFDVNHIGINNELGFIGMTPSSLVATNMAISCKSITQSSDSRLKKEKRKINKKEKCLLDTLQPCIYKFKKKKEKTGKKHIGLYAQEILDSMADLGLKPDEYALVEKGKDGYYSVNYIELIPLMITEIQSLKRRIEVLESGDN